MVIGVKRCRVTQVGVVALNLIGCQLSPSKRTAGHGEDCPLAPPLLPPQQHDLPYQQGQVPPEDDREPDSRAQQQQASYPHGSLEPQLQRTPQPSVPDAKTLGLDPESAAKVSLDRRWPMDQRLFQGRSLHCSR